MTIKKRRNTSWLRCVVRLALPFLIVFNASAFWPVSDNIDPLETAPPVNRKIMSKIFVVFPNAEREWSITYANTFFNRRVIKILEAPFSIDAEITVQTGLNLRENSVSVVYRGKPKVTTIEITKGASPEKDPSTKKDFSPEITDCFIKNNAQHIKQDFGRYSYRKQ
jgi:hypothetical protein